ncbi:LysR family transcriptional regulator [Acetobacter sp. TBRC 12305]|uniref:LysR family transcriptional regulator n=2 Tax=Acetobacter garciniae TaxID=2817435 RepID=A0A939HPK5_9PROT|nr:LysR family transcriptional regulator [Acetobacter garciniae]MBX0344685.1 LysR family transcriptional regulator [Acetobacter garciniae]
MGSFRRAATRVHRSPSAVSLQVGKLEELLATQLLLRDARRISLTEHGEVLLAFARRLIDINDEAMAVFRTSPLKGRLRLAAPPDLGTSLVPGMLRRLAEIHPGIVVDVRLDTSAAVQRMFAQGEIGLALFNETDKPFAHARELFSEPLIWLMRASGHAVERDPLPLAIAEIGCAWRDAALKALQAAGHPYRVAYSSDTSAGQIAALRADLAVAALPKSLADQELVRIPAKYNMPPLPLTRIWLATDGSKLAEAFITLAAPELTPGAAGRD